MERNQPNYLIIILVLALIGVYGYFSNKSREDQEFMYDQSEIISDQQRLIKLYELYFLTINQYQQQDFLYPNKDDTYPTNRPI